MGNLCLLVSEGELKMKKDEVDYKISQKYILFRVLQPNYVHRYLSGSSSFKDHEYNLNSSPEIKVQFQF